MTYVLQVLSSDYIFFILLGEKPSSETPAGDYPHVITKDNGKTALCVQAFTYTKYLGNLTVTFDDAGDVTEWSGNPILLDDSVAKGDMKYILL